MSQPAAESWKTWCNVIKTKKLIVNLRKKSRPHQSTDSGGTTVKKMNIFYFLEVHINMYLTWTHHISYVIRNHSYTFLESWGDSSCCQQFFYHCSVVHSQ